MKLKEFLEYNWFRCQYQLTGAKTGKLLFRSWRNKKTNEFDEYEVSCFRTTARIMTADCIQPFIDISLREL